MDKGLKDRRGCYKFIISASRTANKLRPNWCCVMEKLVVEEVPLALLYGLMSDSGRSVSTFLTRSTTMCAQHSDLHLLPPLRLKCTGTMFVTCVATGQPSFTSN